MYEVLLTKVMIDYTGILEFRFSPGFHS